MRNWIEEKGGKKRSREEREIPGEVGNAQSERQKRRRAETKHGREKDRALKRNVPVWMQRAGETGALKKSSPKRWPLIHTRCQSQGQWERAFRLFSFSPSFSPSSLSLCSSHWVHFHLRKRDTFSHIWASYLFLLSASNPSPFSLPICLYFLFTYWFIFGWYVWVFFLHIYLYNTLIPTA